MCIRDSVNGDVERIHTNSDGTMNIMSKKEMLSNRTMFLIGRIPLDVEHALMYKLRVILFTAPFGAVKIHGCINDCLLVTPINPKDKTDHMNEPAAKATWPDGSRVFRVSGAYHQAPPIEWRYPTATPAPSVYRVDNGPTERPPGAYGAWLSNMPVECCYDVPWVIPIKEEEGLGCGDDDTFQAQAVERIMRNGGAYVAGRGGTGKSRLIEILR